MKYELVIGFVFFTVLVSIQYTLNKILVELKEIRKNLAYKRLDNK